MLPSGSIRYKQCSFSSRRFNDACCISIIPLKCIGWNTSPNFCFYNDKWVKAVPFFFKTGIKIISNFNEIKRLVNFAPIVIRNCYMIIFCFSQRLRRAFFTRWLLYRRPLLSTLCDVSVFSFCWSFGKRKARNEDFWI